MYQTKMTVKLISSEVDESEDVENYYLLMKNILKELILTKKLLVFHTIQDILFNWMIN